MLKIMKLGAVIASFCLFLSGMPIGGGYLSSSGLYSATYLVVGMDEAAENTDVLSLINVNSVEDKISYIQIPRDTYCNFDAYNNKINHVYSTAKASGMSKKDSMRRLSDFIESALSVKIDGYFAFKQDTLCDFVDGIGGIYVTLDKDISIPQGNGKTREFKRGENFLSASDTLLLSRHRKGYPRGDLDRLDVQKKIFLGLVKSLSTVKKRTLLDALKSASKNSLTSLTILDAVKLISGRESLKNASIKTNTLVGEAVLDSRGISYYVLNKNANSRILAEMFGQEKYNFDPNQNFLKNDDLKFKSIYFSIDM